MKKNNILLAFSFLFLINLSYATRYTVQVSNFSFNPSSISNVHPGDTIHWVWVSGSHTTTSSSIPAGAATWDEPINSTSTVYDYVPAVAGVYNYVCTPHATMGMVGSFTVVSNPDPLSVVASADNSSLCKGQSTWLRASPSGGTGSYSYSWTSNPPGFTSNQQNVQITPAVTRSYTVTVVSGSQSANSSTSVSVTAPAVVSAGADTTYCDNITQFQITGTGSGYSQLLWTTSGDGVFSNPTGLSGSYTPGPNDKTATLIVLTLTATPVAPCLAQVADSVHILMSPCSGIGEKSGSKLVIYPNPASGNFNVSGTSDSRTTLSVYDLSGRTIYSEEITSKGDFSRNIHLDYKGMAFVRVGNGKNISSAKMIIY